MELRPCPICKHTDLSFFEEGVARKRDEEMYFIERPEYHIECDTCGYEIYGYGKKDAELSWNTTEPSQWEINHWSKKVNNNNGEKSE